MLALVSMNENQRIAARLREVARRLEENGDNAFRVAAFRRAADTAEQCDRPLRDIYEVRGTAGLRELPGIGAGIAGAIAEMLISGRWLRLERLRRARRVPHGPERVFTYSDEDGAEHECVVVGMSSRKNKDPSAQAS